MSFYPEGREKQHIDAPVPEDWGMGFQPPVQGDAPQPPADPFFLPDVWQEEAPQPGEGGMPVLPTGLLETGQPIRPRKRRAQHIQHRAQPPAPRRAAVQGEAAAPPPAGETRPPAAPPPRRGKKRRYLPVCAVLMLLSAGVIFAGAGAYSAALRSQEQYARSLSPLQPGVLPQNMYIDDVPVGGLSVDEALSRLRTVQHYEQKNISLRVHTPQGTVYEIGTNDIPFSRNTEMVVMRAAAFSWGGMRALEDSDLAPVDLRLRNLQSLAATPEGARHYTMVTYSQEDVFRLVSNIAQRENRQTRDAQVVFDFATGTAAFTEECEGRHLDADALYSDILALLDAGCYQADIAARVTVTEPKVRCATLMANFGLISSYTTTTTQDQDRNTNVRLACEALNGTIVYPGTRFSFNETIGQRTQEKGYRPAAAIAGGTTVDEIGGGVCQVSSTLFNAAAMADMTILERSPHTWPSNYVDKGRDATVNWPNLDLTFVNGRETPVYIRARYADRRCTVEVYGIQLAAGETIELETELASETPPPDTPIYRQNASLPRGTQQEVKKARTGYVVNTYRVYKRNGVTLRREVLCVSTYRMIQQEIEYN